MHRLATVILLSSLSFCASAAVLNGDDDSTAGSSVSTPVVVTSQAEGADAWRMSPDKVLAGLKGAAASGGVSRSGSTYCTASVTPVTIAFSADGASFTARQYTGSTLMATYNCSVDPAALSEGACTRTPSGAAGHFDFKSDGVDISINAATSTCQPYAGFAKWTN